MSVKVEGECEGGRVSVKVEGESRRARGRERVRVGGLEKSEMAHSLMHTQKQYLFPFEGATHQDEREHLCGREPGRQHQPVAPAVVDKLGDTRGVRHNAELWAEPMIALRAIGRAG